MKNSRGLKRILFLLFLCNFIYADDSDTDIESEENKASEIIINIPDRELPFREDRLSQIAVLAYLEASNFSFAQALNSHLSNRVRDAMLSPVPAKKKAVDLIRKVAIENDTNEDSIALRELHRMIVDATQDVYIEQNREIEKIKKNMDKRWTKKKAAILTSTCTLLGAICSAVVSYFTSKTQC